MEELEEEFYEEVPLCYCSGFHLGVIMSYTVLVLCDFLLLVALDILYIHTCTDVKM